jgi:hypothetical protein
MQLKPFIKIRAHFHPPQARLRQAKTALFGALAASPLRGAASCFATPTIALRINLFSFALRAKLKRENEDVFISKSFPADK